MINENIRTISSSNDHADQQTSRGRIRHTPEINEDIFNKTLKEIIDKRNQEERKANGRSVAVIVAFLVTFLTIYHAWIRNSGMLAGVVVPAVIMLSFGIWVLILAKRDKARNELFDKYLEEVSLQHRRLIAEANKSKQQKRITLSKLHYKNEVNNNRFNLSTAPLAAERGNNAIKGEKFEQNSNELLIKANQPYHKHSTSVHNLHRKQLWHKQRLNLGRDYDGANLQKLAMKRPSLRQLLFTTNNSKNAVKFMTTKPSIIIQDDDQKILIKAKHKSSQQHNNHNNNNNNNNCNIITPIKKKVVRWSSAP